MLARLTDIDIVGESLYMVQLQQIDRLLVEIQVLVDKLSVYVHREEDPALLMEGEDSSEFLVNMAVHMLNGQDSQVFKKALTCFLMEKFRVGFRRLVFYGMMIWLLFCGSI